MTISQIVMICISITIIGIAISAYLKIRHYDPFDKYLRIFFLTVVVEIIMCYVCGLYGCPILVYAAVHVALIIGGIVIHGRKDRSKVRLFEFCRTYPDHEICERYHSPIDS